MANYPDHLSNTLVRGLTPDPILATATCFFWTGPQIEEVLDQGSVLAVHVFGSLSIYFTPQLKIVPDYHAGRLTPIRINLYPIYSLTYGLSSVKNKK